MNRPAPWRSIMGTVVDRRPFKVGGATVDPVSRDACWRDGKERLQPQTLKVLLALASHRDEVVTRDELIQLCWDGRAVSDDVINRAILLLRHLSERAGGFEIETVPRTGYRLIERQAPVNGWRQRRWFVAVAAVLLVIGGVGWSWLTYAPANQGMPPTPTIAVAPFSAAANDPLARQVAQTAPASLERMMSESGFAIVRADPPGEGPSRTDYVFRGSVRHTGNSVEATLQLVSQRDGTITFAHDFSAPIDRAADLPDRIGATAAAELAWTGAEMVLDRRQHLDPEIASELMKSMTLTIEQGDSLRAYQLARHAASLAPNSAIAQLTLAVQTGFSIESIPREERTQAVTLARRASDRARVLAPEFGDVYIPGCLLHSPVRMVECEARLRKALGVDFSSSFVPGYLSALHYNAGSFDDALQLARQSLANDPYKPAKLARMIRMLEATGNSAEADRLYQEATRLWPDNARFGWSRLQGLAEGGNYARLAALMGGSADAPMLAGLLAAQRTNDLPAAQRACEDKSIKPFGLTLCMAVLADLGDMDRSFAIAADLYPAWHADIRTDEDRVWLDNPDGFATAFLTSPAAHSMRADRRFLDLAQKLGLLDYWRSGRLPDFCTKAHEPVCARVSGQKANK